MQRNTIFFIYILYLAFCLRYDSVMTGSEVGAWKVHKMGFKLWMPITQQHCLSAHCPQGYQRQQIHIIFFIWAKQYYETLFVEVRCRAVEWFFISLKKKSITVKLSAMFLERCKRHLLNISVKHIYRKIMESSAVNAKTNMSDRPLIQ